MTCEQVQNGTILARWYGAGAAPYDVNQLFRVHTFVENGETKKRALKIVWDAAEGGFWYEGRGRNCFTFFPLEPGVTGGEVVCLSGQDTGYNLDPSTPALPYYWKDGNIFKPFLRPTIVSSGNVGIAITGTTFQDGTIKVYKDNVYQTGADFSTSNKNFTYTPSAAATYKFVLTNTSGTSDFSADVVVIADPANTCTQPAGSVSAQNNGIFTVGGTITIELTGGANITGRQWYKGTQVLAGKTGTTLVIENAQASDVGSYSLLLTNNCGGGKTASTKQTNSVNIALGTLATKKVCVVTKPEAPCANATMQFGYNTVANSTVVTNWVDSEGTVLVALQGGETVIVTQNGTLVQFKDFVLNVGTYYFYVRQKDEPNNIKFIGQYTVTAS